MGRMLAATAVVALALVAGAQARTHATVLHIKTSPTALRFNVSSLTARAGEVTIVMTNMSALPHDVAIKGNGVNVKGKTVGKGGTSTARAKLKKGKYTFYCSVPGHEAAGMKGTLTVK